MFLFLSVVFSITTLISGGILPSHDRYLQKHGITCGTKLDTTSQVSKARVLNGNQVTNKEYPWLAIIWRSIFGSNGRKTLSSCGGVIISRHAILTAGRCLCNDDPNLKDKDGVKLTGNILTCGRDLNLNKEANNQIEYSIGTQSTALVDEKHNANLEAYLYDFDLVNIFFSKNGDIGIVIDKNGLPLNKHQANPICLPTDTSFSKSASEWNEGVEVTLAGRGLRFVNSRKVDNSDNPITSCLTNEGRKTYTRGMNFQKCKPLEYPGVYSSFCVETPFVYDLISSEADVIFNVNDYKKTVNARIKLPRKGKCQKYWDKALEAYRKANKKFSPTKTLIHDAHRIVLRNSKNSNVDYKVCLNWRKLSVYGVCKTELDWGFCSRSCQVSSRIPHDSRIPGYPIQPQGAQFAEYEEFRALYFDNPGNIIRSDSSILSKTSLRSLLTSMLTNINT